MEEEFSAAHLHYNPHYDDTKGVENLQSFPLSHSWHIARLGTHM